jgi:hypothetical protein
MAYLRVHEDDVKGRLFESLEGFEAVVCYCYNALGFSELSAQDLEKKSVRQMEGRKEEVVTDLLIDDVVLYQ